MTLAESLEKYKERVEKALAGEIAANDCNRDEDIHYKGATKEECDREILDIVDFLIFQLDDYNECLGAFERAVMEMLPKRKYKKLYTKFIEHKFLVDREPLPFE